MADKTSFGSWVGAVWNSVSSGWPNVTVPVLSKATTDTCDNSCKAWPLRNKIPKPAARPIPTIIDVGVANPMAQGHAMIKTDTPATKENDISNAGASTSHSITVSTDNPMTTGTNHNVTRSTKFWFVPVVMGLSVLTVMLWLVL